MPLESATKISELNDAWHLGTDSMYQWDNHIRMIKILKHKDGMMSTVW